MSSAALLEQRAPAAIEELVRSLSGERAEPVCAYLYDLAALRRHAAQIVAALPAACQMFYAIKANSEAPILRALAPIVHGFEVASIGEVERVRAADAGAPVIFGGPGKTDQEIERAIQLGVERIHVESLHELRRIEQIGQRLGAVVPILLRVNLRGGLPAATLQMAGKATQFGIEEDALPDAIAEVRRCRQIDLQGFHLHSLSNNLDAAAHVQLVQSYIRHARRWADTYDLPVTVLNVGGGIGVNYQDLERQFDWASFTAQLGQVLRAELPDSWRVLFECGRFISAACGFYAAEVLDIKHNHGADFVIVRGGTHQFRLPASWAHSHPFAVVPVERWPYPFARPQTEGGRVTVVGQLCTPKDVLARDVPVPQVRAGDILLFLYTGAYGWAISHHDFLSHPHPQHLFVD